MNIGKLIIAGITVLSFSCHYSEKQDIVIPVGYEGWFAIVYDCECGEDKNLVNGRLQQIIPSKGVLLVSYQRPKGVVNMNVYEQQGDSKNLLLTIEPGEDINENDINFATHLSRYSFNGKSKCASEEGEFYEHDIVFYKINYEDGKSQMGLDSFENKLDNVLRLK